MKALNIIALVLVIVGGLIWGLVGALNFNLVAFLFGVDSIISNIVYILVGVSAIYCAAMLKPFSSTAMATKPTA